MEHISVRFGSFCPNMFGHKRRFICSRDPGELSDLTSKLALKTLRKCSVKISKERMKQRQGSTEEKKKTETTTMSEKSAVELDLATSTSATDMTDND